MRPFSSIVLSDGGVYDNTGVAWFLDSTERNARLKRSLELNIATSPLYDSPSKPVRQRVEAQLASMKHVPELQIVVNSSFPQDWSSMALRRIPIFGEIAALLRLEGVLYENRGREQARDLHRHFFLQLRNGAMVSIEQHPEGLPMAFGNVGQLQHAFEPLLKQLAPDAQGILDGALRELGVSDMGPQLLEHYCELAEAIRDRAALGPEYKTVRAKAAQDYREVEEQLAKLRAKKVLAPSISLEEAQLGSDIRDCEHKQHEIFMKVQEKRANWYAARVEEVDRQSEERLHSWKAPTTFRPLGAKTTAELLRHGLFKLHEDVLPLARRLSLLR